jgi:hypothetical protein
MELLGLTESPSFDVWLGSQEIGEFVMGHRSYNSAVWRRINNAQRCFLILLTLSNL